MRAQRRLLADSLSMSAETQALGELGERVAARWLVRRGWRVVAHRFRSGHRDLDLVVRRGGTVAFVEVKTRRAADGGARAGQAFGGPTGAVTWRKQRELVRSAWAWVDRHGRAGEAYRFDVIGVVVTPRGVRIRHVADAFRVRPDS
jgi:putative endonuclease